jgi:predicted nucleic acid-binding protein
VVGELFFGAAKSSRPQRTRPKSSGLAGRPILPCDFDVARAYGRVRHAFGTKGGLFPKTTFGSPLRPRVTICSGHP